MKVLFARAAVAAALCMLSPIVTNAQNVVADWDAIALNTIVTVAGKSPISTPVYFSYVSVAEYDSVNAIEHRHRAFAVTVAAPHGASVDSAVIAAAHDVLVHYFPAQKAALDADQMASLAAIPFSQGKVDGITVGQVVAARWLVLRANDGVDAPIGYVWGSGPGVWEPVPPFPPPAAVWAAYFTPFTFPAASDFLGVIDPTLSLKSEEWADDFNLTKAYGSLTSTVRTPQQTEIGRFWADHPGTIDSRALRFLIAEHQLNASESARLAAMQWVTLSDSLTACFNAKYHYAFWRPYTAIHNADTDGNPLTVADPNWVPLDVTPGHPEYPAAHGCGTEALAIALRTYFQSDNVHYQVTSNVTSTTHDFQRFSDLVREVDWARIYGGMHYRHSVLQGNVMGVAVACHVLKTHFDTRCLLEDEE